MAKLCACACGGAIVGGGAVKVSEGPRAGYVKTTYKKRVVRTTRTVAARAARVRKVVTTTTTACPPATVTVAGGPPLPVPPAFVGSS